MSDIVSISVEAYGQFIIWFHLQQMILHTKINKLSQPLILTLPTISEVEQLLGPEERAILQENKTPNFDKISTVMY